MARQIAVGDLQWSTLSQMLFNLYSSDIASNPQDMTTLYADGIEVVESYDHKSSSSSKRPPSRSSEEVNRLAFWNERGHVGNRHFQKE